MIDKTSLTGSNQFMCSCQKLLIDKKGVVTQNFNFLLFPAYLHLNINWYTISQSFQNMYRLGLVILNTVNSKFHLIQTFFKIFETFLSFQC